MGSETLHENGLSAATVDMHRAIVSLMEELEAIDWYQQRVEASTDEELKRILAHNRDEEKEHAAMLIEWIRRRDRGFDVQLREYLFRDGPLPGREGVNGASEPGRGAAPAPRLIGSLRGGS
jgi:ferritin-like protein